jgi:hypothetical protein
VVISHRPKNESPIYYDYSDTYFCPADPETQSAAAALAVSVGQLQDPPEVQGMYVVIDLFA